MTTPSRRTFLKTSALAGGSTLFLAGTTSSAKVIGANDRLRVAVAGLKGRGSSHIGGYLKQPNVEIAYLVDPDSNVLGGRMKDLEKRSKGKFTTKGVADVREALEDPELDAVSIATPNHWHSLMTIWAAQAGKHVYVEKPMSHDVVEGRVAVAEAQKYGVVIQHGTQRRSSSGIAGLTRRSSRASGASSRSLTATAASRAAASASQGARAPPANLDWSLWKGPAVVDEFHGNSSTTTGTGSGKPATAT
jgi:predicted dehydrogenase